MLNLFSSVYKCSGGVKKIKIPATTLPPPKKTAGTASIGWCLGGLNFLHRFFNPKFDMLASVNVSKRA